MFQHLPSCLIVLAVSFLGFLGCATQRSTPRLTGPTFVEPLPPRIGLIADSQVNTPHSRDVPLQRSKIADFFVDVAIRPPASDHLVTNALDYLLLPLKSNDVILVLGDMANNGCIDELSIVTNVLGNARKQFQIPIFLVIGNHDYLGAGNTTEDAKRLLLCGCDSRAASKMSVIKLMQAFNSQNTNFSSIIGYEDNLKLLLGREKEFEQDPGAHANGCFFASRFILAKGADSVEFFLTDTSDYNGTKLKPKLVEEWNGMRGFMSMEQVSFFTNFPTAYKYRVIASHYPVTDFRPVLLGIFRVSKKIGWPGKLLSTNGNLWVSAHTHTPEPQVERYQIFDPASGESTSFNHVNVGSIIDYKPQANSLVGAADAFKLVTHYIEEDDLEKEVRNAINKGGTAFEEVLGQRSGETIFGLTRAYKKGNKWTGEHSRRARGNLEVLVATFPPAKQLAVRAVLARIAAQNEGRKSR